MKLLALTLLVAGTEAQLFAGLTNAITDAADVTKEVTAAVTDVAAAAASTANQAIEKYDAGILEAAKTAAGYATMDAAAKTAFDAA